MRPLNAINLPKKEFAVVGMHRGRSRFSLDMRFDYKLTAAVEAPNNSDETVLHITPTSWSAIPRHSSAHTTDPHPASMGTGIIISVDAVSSSGPGNTESVNVLVRHDSINGAVCTYPSTVFLAWACSCIDILFIVNSSGQIRGGL